jgi:hypothetical protein
MIWAPLSVCRCCQHVISFIAICAPFPRQFCGGIRANRAIEWKITRFASAPESKRPKLKLHVIASRFAEFSELQRRRKQSQMTLRSLEIIVITQVEGRSRRQLSCKWRQSGQPWGNLRRLQTVFHKLFALSAKFNAENRFSCEWIWKTIFLMQFHASLTWFADLLQFWSSKQLQTTIFVAVLCDNFLLSTFLLFPAVFQCLETFSSSLLNLQCQNLHFLPSSTEVSVQPHKKRTREETKKLKIAYE